MTETDSVRLARMEEKLDAWLDRSDERHGNNVKSIASLESKVATLEQDRAKMVGAAVVVGGIMGAIGSTVLKMFGGK